MVVAIFHSAGRLHPVVLDNLAISFGGSFWVHLVRFGSFSLVGMPTGECDSTYCTIGDERTTGPKQDACSDLGETIGVSEPSSKPSI